MLNRSLTSKLHKINMILCFFIFTSGFLVSVNAQKAMPKDAHGIGVRFAGDFNYFFRAEKKPLVDGWYSNVNVGIFYKYYANRASVQLGFNYLH